MTENVSPELVEALKASIVALNDWLCTYAYDQCDDQSVAEARKRIGQYGTIGYIAQVQDQNRRALALATQGDR